MAYTTDTQINHHMGTDLTTALKTLDTSVTVATVIAQARQDAEAYLDAKLSKRYVVPFAAITDTPDTPDLVQAIAKDLTAYELLRKRHPKIAQGYLDEADAQLTELLEGETSIPGATEVDAADARVGFTASDTTPIFSGLDDEGDDRMEGW